MNAKKENKGLKVLIAPSILSADKNNLQLEVDKISKAADILHVDIMDGRFVPEKAFTAHDISRIITSLPKDVHLMVRRPVSEGWIDDFIDAGASIITIHEECEDDIAKTLDYIRRRNVRASISINPPTPLKRLDPYLGMVSMVLIMSVNPGYAGQPFIPEVLDKVRALRQKRPDLDIEIDGGIKESNVRLAVGAGANIIVAGSAIFGSSDPVSAIKKMKEKAVGS